MTIYSQNGYVACQPSLIGKYTIKPSTVTINLRMGDVSVVLLDFFGWYHVAIEPLHQDDTGGYNCRTIEGSTTTSNHGSGTAGDVRWNDHPRGKRNAGFTAAEVDKINTKLKEYGGVIRWGNNYSSPSIPDAMHFEINAGPVAVKVQAERIRAKNAGGDVSLDKTDLAAINQEVRNGITSWWYDAFTAANGKAPADTQDDKRKRNYRDYVRKVTGGPVDQTAILAAIAASGNVDVLALAAALRPGLAADIIAGLPDDGTPLTEDQVEQAIRNVLGSLG